MGAPGPISWCSSDLRMNTWESWSTWISRDPVPGRYKGNWLSN